jgi:predicted NBD/HSP70 family sugar kinase
MKGDNDMVLAIDLGGTKILSAVIERGGSMLARDHSVTPAALGQEAVIEAIGASVQRAIAQANADISEMHAVGIGAPGPSNPEKSILFTSPNLPRWHNVPIRPLRRLGKEPTRQPMRRCDLSSRRWEETPECWEPRPTRSGK